jgi:hypothetical protein
MILASKQAVDIIGLASHIDVQGKDPIACAVRLKNNSWKPGAMYRVGFLFGLYNPVNYTFSCLVIEYSGETYLVGSFLDVELPEQGAERAYGIPTYAAPVSEIYTLDAFCFLAQWGLTWPVLKVNWGGVVPSDPDNGNWIIGINSRYFPWKSLYFQRIFSGVITISPAAS